MTRDMSTIMQQVKDEVRGAVEASCRTVSATASARVPEPKHATVKVEKILHDAIAREIESVVLPMADEMAVRTDKLVSAAVLRLSSDVSSAREVEERMRILESKLATLESLSAAQPRAASNNPYADIEHLAKTGSWESAWRRSVEVYNGIDFMVHLISGMSAEDFFSANPVNDPLLALQICINASQEMLQSDKSVTEKLDIVSELVLGLTNPNRLNLSHQFSRLRQLVDQLVMTMQSSRTKEIQKIIMATERLLTPPISVEATPAPALRYPAATPSPMYP